MQAGNAASGFAAAEKPGFPGTMRSKELRFKHIHLAIHIMAFSIDAR